MKLDPGNLRVFVAVSEDLGFRRAVERLRVAQPALSRSIRALEARLGCPLLIGTTRCVELTVAGRAFLEEAPAPIAHADRAVVFAREADAGQQGHLAVAYLSHPPGL